jgi:hypothetical protein
MNVATPLSRRNSGSERNRCCPHCNADLQLHQPDVSMPNRILGVCPGCHAWTLVHFGRDGRMEQTALVDPA